MKAGFKETNSIKSQEPKNSPIDGKNSPWNFSQPSYDQRSSCFVKAGTNFGECQKQPIGSTSNPKNASEMLPMSNRVKMAEYVSG